MGVFSIIRESVEKTLNEREDFSEETTETIAFWTALIVIIILWHFFWYFLGQKIWNETIVDILPVKSVDSTWDFFKMAWCMNLIFL